MPAQTFRLPLSCAAGRIRHGRQGAGVRHNRDLLRQHPVRPLPRAQPTRARPRRLRTRAAPAFRRLIATAASAWVDAVRRHAAESARIPCTLYPVPRVVAPGPLHGYALRGSPSRGDWSRDASCRCCAASLRRWKRLADALCSCASACGTSDVAGAHPRQLLHGSFIASAMVCRRLVYTRVDVPTLLGVRAAQAYGTAPLLPATDIGVSAPCGVAPRLRL